MSREVPESLLEALLRLRNADPSAYEESAQQLVAAVWNLTYRWTLPRLRASDARAPEDDAADLSQEAALRVLRSAAVCRAATEAQVTAWVLTIARNLFLDHLRRERRRTAALTSYHTMSRSRERWLVRHSIDDPNCGATALGAALRSLDEKEQQLIQLRLGEGATWSEVAHAMRCTPAAAKRRYQRIVARLRRLGGAGAD